MGLKIIDMQLIDDYNVSLTLQKFSIEGRGVDTRAYPIGDTEIIPVPLEDLSFDRREFGSKEFYRVILAAKKDNEFVTLSVGIKQNLVEKLKFWKRESKIKKAFGHGSECRENAVVTKQFINAIMSLKIDED